MLKMKCHEAAKNTIHSGMMEKNSRKNEKILSFNLHSHICGSGYELIFNLKIIHV